MIETNAGGQEDHCAGKVDRESGQGKSSGQAGSGELKFILLQSIRMIPKTVTAQTP